MDVSDMNSVAGANARRYLREEGMLSAEAHADHALTRTPSMERARNDGVRDDSAHHQLAPLQHAPDDIFRAIRMRLLALGGGRNFVTLVVSVSPRSGASFVARNLATAFAFDAAKTALLIDCNLKHPAQHAALGIDAAPGGLLDYLEQQQRTLQQVMYRTRVPRLSLIPAGHAHVASAEPFSSARMRALIDGVRAQHPDRYVLLDAPALTSSPDALLLSDLADYVVIVAAFGRDTAAAINQAAAGLDPKKVAGVIFNYPP
jgi:protein-tyrosine kinase